MENVLISTERQDIDDRIRAHGLDPRSFSYRRQASECVTRYVRLPGRVFGKHVPKEALALYPKDRNDRYITFERDPRSGFQSSFRPSLAGDLSARAQTWQELMGLLDAWLERLTKDKAASEGVDRRAAEQATRGHTVLRREGSPTAGSKRREIP